jgi:hypothetical protein
MEGHPQRVHGRLQQLRGDATQEDLGAAIPVNHVPVAILH